MRELIESQKIKKISEADILNQGTIFGNELMILVNQKINSAPDSLIYTLCGNSGVTLLDSLGLVHQSKIVRLDMFSTNLSDEERVLVEASQYAFDSGEPIGQSIQKKDDKNILYLTPVNSASRLFSMCQQEAGKPTKNTFPSLWSITIPIKEIILKME